MRLVLLSAVAVTLCTGVPVAAQEGTSTIGVHLTPTDSNLVFGNVANAALLMDVYRPKASNGLGLIFISGSGWGGQPQYRHGYDDTPLKDDARNGQYEGRLVEGLVSRGYTVFAINHRFAPESPFPGPFYDAQRAVRFVRAVARRYSVDPGRLGAIGHSSGGHLAAMIGVKDTVIDNPRHFPYQDGSSQVQAVVSLAAPFIMTHTNLARPGNVRIVTNLTGPLPAPLADGSFPLTDALTAASPLAHVTAQSAPTLMIQAENDSTILKTSAPLMAARLTKYGVANELRMLPSGGHAPKYDLDAIDAWFRRYLKE